MHVRQNNKMFKIVSVNSTDKVKKEEELAASGQEFYDDIVNEMAFLNEDECQVIHKKRCSSKTRKN